ncbi:MAG TPA: epimerase [Burkholderiaceae bacterium]|nr:epimerase [Burkholderiaceae bacterium]
MTTSLPAVLVLGASGRFGRSAVQAFAQAGYPVLAQSRSPLAGLPSCALHLAMAPDDPRLAQRAAGVRSVVHAVNPAYDRWEREALQLARQGMDLAARLQATFLLPGNVYNFGESMPERLTPDTAQRPSTRKGRIRCDLEDLMSRRAQEGLDAVVIRAGDFFGAGTGSWLDLVIARSLSSGKLVYPGPLDQPHAWAYLPDLARAFVAVARRQHDPSCQRGLQRFHFAGHTVTGEQWLAAIESAARTLGIGPARPFSRGAMPWGLIRAGGLVVPMWREIAEMAYLWRVPHRLDGGALSVAVGPLPQTPLDQALSDSLIALGLAQRSAA